jgi:hypothetical protein
MMALLRYFSHFSLDVDNLTDDELAKEWGRLQFSLKQTGQYKE